MRPFLPEKRSSFPVITCSYQLKRTFLFLSFILAFGMYAGTVSASVKYTGKGSQAVFKKTDVWTLIYSDSVLKIYAMPGSCGTTDVMRLKAENLTSTKLNFSYKIWAASSPKTLELNGSTTIEGICSVEYNNLLVEETPSGSGMSNINVTINYLP